MEGKPSPKTVSTKLERIAGLAKQMPDVALTSLSHHIDIDWLKEAYRRTRKGGAVGVDGQTGREYAENLEENLQGLLDRAKSGDHYRAPPVRRVHIPKGDGRKTRPIGIPTFEDKILQRAVAMALGAVYEEDFLDCSWGFRPGRSAHGAVDALWEQAMKMGGGWVLEADIEAFFDSVDHGKLQQVVRQRVRDGVLLRLIGKWLNAGVMEEGLVYRPGTGTPQGGVISPLLANIYLHDALDLWFERDVKPRLRSRAALVRYADDFVMVFERQEDACRVMAVLGKRLEKYGLRLHPEKTRLVEFNRPGSRRGGRPETFDLLGFTFYWGRSRKGKWVVKHKTASSRFSRALHSITLWMRRNRHAPVRWQHTMLTKKLRGHYAYYGVTSNRDALKRFMWEVKRRWQKWLARRSSRRHLTWDKAKILFEVYPLPLPRVVHSRLS